MAESKLLPILPLIYLRFRPNTDLLVRPISLLREAASIILLLEKIRFSTLYSYITRPDIYFTVL